MIESLTTEAEKKALEAESLEAFSGIQLLHIKKQLEHLLGLIGGNGIFDEYTKHDISHIDSMLVMLDWLIPENTKSIMTPADWLLTVLAIYFHDLGMLVTKAEYKARKTSGFPKYRDEVLFADDTGTDYRSKVERLDPDEAERFLYQEFVRANHAERIRWWVLGEVPQHLGISADVVREVDDLLKPFGTVFRGDLALVCESHHSDDLDDFKKYKTSQPYGPKAEETANVHYASLLLRTADLLHITRDRTPSIVFRTINPADPISQVEWAKQMAVRSVRSQVAKDSEGKIDDSLPKITIEVHANFKEESGFFGLTSYLKYASSQIQQSHEWARMANEQQAVSHQFPWRYLDDSYVEAENFVKNTFEFTLDQEKILNLLTGHTLYNESGVVLRELVQNSLDAVRLQKVINERGNVASEEARVEIHWDSEKRLLSVKDNGTGMTQEIIEANLLTVGASRYQTEEFRKQFPQFSPISRFGIGILSSFMIADDVEIITSLRWTPLVGQ